MSNFGQKTDKALVLSQDPNTAMHEMMSTIDELRGIYQRETEALEISDTKAFLAMQESKLNAARKYQDGIEQIIERKNNMKSANPLLRKRLEEMQKDFFELSSKNLEALSRMHRTTERLGNTIRSAARDAAKKQRAFSYGETGSLHTQEKKSVSMGISETA